MKPLDPRRAAVDLVTRVEDTRAFLEPLLAAFLERAPAARDEDRGLLTELAYGTLRLRNRLDWILDRFLRGNAATLDPGLRNILRVALYQLFCMDRVPSYAAVNEAVKLAKRRYPGRDALVNGLLRNALRQSAELSFPDRENDPVEFAVRYHSHPRWLVKQWIDEYGPVETLELCEANNRTPPFTLRVNRLKITVEEAIRSLSNEGFGAAAGRWSPDGVILERRGVSPRKLSLLEEGYLQVQDEASQIVSFLAAPRPGERVLDLCSGVGIKATHLAALMENRGTIVAVDRNKRKLESGRVRARIMGATIIEHRLADAVELPGSGFSGSFDRVLLDAPCSGLGTVRRKPEIRWFTGEGDIEEAAVLQGRLLRAGADCLKTGGVLIYATCAMSRRENEDVVRTFLDEHPFFELRRPGPPVHDVMIDDEGFFRTSPHRHETDGFFGAVLAKREPGPAAG